MFRRDILSWWLRPGFLRPGGNRRDTLFAGPWVGEFGWELLNWQAFVRKLSRSYRKTVVCCPAGREALYADFAAVIHGHKLRGVSECNVMHKVENPEELERMGKLVPPDCDWLKPMGYQPFSRQEFIRFGKPRTDLSVDVLFHPRGRGFGTERNWDAEKWRELLGLLRGQGLRLGCIGVSSATVKVEGEYTDFRDKPLFETLDVIASARTVIGPSSGPMHLASLCGTPHVVWTDRGRYARGRTNRDKYETWWNPLGTRALVLDEHGFDPAPKAVAEAVARLVRA